MGSVAEHYRRHRQAMSLALELHCTPAEAQAELDRRAARGRWEETRRRLDAVRLAPLQITGPTDDAPTAPRDERWMMRN